MVGIALIDNLGGGGRLQIAVIMRRHDDEAGAALLRLPDGLSGGYAAALGFLTFGEDDAVALLWVAADGHGLASELRVVPLLHAGVEII